MSQSSDTPTPLQLFCAPADPALARQRRKLRKSLLAREGLKEKRIAILGGSTTTELAGLLEIFLLNCGIRPVIHQSEYGQYYEDVMFGSPELDEFRPEVIYLHTTVRNLKETPAMTDGQAEIDELLDRTTATFTGLWDAIEKKYGCAVIQNNFDPPPYRPLGNLDGTDPRGLTRFARILNERFAAESMKRPGLIIQDIDRLAAETGLDAWHDPASWFAYKCAPGLNAVPRLAQNLAAQIRALSGMASKCLVLDLDNTLWGGVIGDDGVENIRLGRETAESSAYLAFQQYAKALKERGVLLAVCSKNEETNALAGLNHPDSALAPDDFTMIRANWSPKSENMAAIAESINIGLDSLVFFDDNPAEREIVRQQLPEVALPEPGEDVSGYIAALDRSGLFESVRLSAEDLERSRYYAENARRNAVRLDHADYGEYLDSLEMEAEIGPFAPQYLDRITQLTNKTNQFNLTTRRYTLPEIQGAAASPDHIALYGRLTDRFGDNGLVSVVLGEVREGAVFIDLWLMSCRVIKRDMELAMFDGLVEAARAKGCSALVGRFVPTLKNPMVKDFYQQLGFAFEAKGKDGETTWRFAIPDNFTPRNTHIKVNHG